MRVVHAAALTAAALLFTSVASAQGLGDAAAAARQKRKAEPAKPTKVYTEGDIGQAMAPVSTTRDLPATNTPATAGGLPATGGLPAGEGLPPAEGQPAVEGQAPAEGGTPGEGPPPMRRRQRTRRQPRRTRRRRPRRPGERDSTRPARKKPSTRTSSARWRSRSEGTGGLYSPGRTANLAFLEENKQKLAETQAKIAALEDEGRRNGYR